MSLKEEIESARKTVKTDKLQLSIGELVSMYESRELNIQPDFQRLFRWSKEKKSNLFESILIDIPIPPVFVFESEDGTWELIDGLQRISTLFEFIGVLRDPETDETLPPSQLSDTTYLPSLANAVWETSNQIIDAPVLDQVPLEKPQQLAIRRSRLDVQVLKQPSDPETKFHLFQRLNRGGSYANEQEVRTCAMVMIDPEIVQIFRSLAASEHFRQITSVSEEAAKNQKDVEYVVRAAVHSMRDYDNRSDVEEFLDQSIVDIMKSEDDITQFAEKFDFALETLFEKFGSRALFPGGGRAAGAGRRFSLRALEAIFVGIIRSAPAIRALENPADFVEAKVLSFWQQPAAEAMSASGLRGTQRLQRTIPFGDQWFRP